VVLHGASHGLILLPVMLSFIGPPGNRSRLAERLRLREDRWSGPPAKSSAPADSGLDQVNTGPA